MSLDRFTSAVPSDAIARCKRVRDFTALYAGTQRPQREPDEVGALAVVDLVFDGRIALHAIDGDREHVRVERLP